MPKYTPPPGNRVDFEFQPYTPPRGNAVNFDFGGTRTSGPYIVSNAELRLRAREHIDEAIELLSAIEGTELERALVDVYLLPELEQVRAVIDLQPDAVDDVRADIESASNRISAILERVPMLRHILIQVVLDLGKILIQLP